MGLEQLPPAGGGGHFAPVRVNEQLILDFMAVESAEGHPSRGNTNRLPEAALPAGGSLSARQPGAHLP